MICLFDLLLSSRTARGGFYAAAENDDITTYYIQRHIRWVYLIISNSLLLCSIRHWLLTLMLLVANFANTKYATKKLKMTEILSNGYSSESTK